jgi:hypothetical protein
MSDARKTLGSGALALAPIGCCIALPLVATAGVSAALVAWIGGLALAVAGLVSCAILLLVHLRRHRSLQPQPRRDSRSLL